MWMSLRPQFRRLTALAAAFAATFAFVCFDQALAQPSPAVEKRASAGPVYGVLSLIGDEFTVVIEQQKTGSKLNNNIARRVPLDTPLFDKTAIGAAVETIKKLNREAEFVEVNTRSPALFEKFRSLFEVEAGVMAIPEPILDLLRQQRATHFLLITKHRDDAKLQFSNMADGSGRLEGLGFFLSGIDETYNREKSTSGQGYIAPYLYAKLTLVELPTQKVLKSRNLTASYTFGATVTKGDGDPWTALTTTEKVRALDTLIRREFANVVPALLIP